MPQAVACKPVSLCKHNAGCSATIAGDPNHAEFRQRTAQEMPEKNADSLLALASSPSEMLEKVSKIADEVVDLPGTHSVYLGLFGLLHE